MNEEKIKVVFKEPFKEPEVRIIENTIVAFKELIDSNDIEIIKFEDVYIVYDRDGQSKGKPLNIAIDALTSIYGNIIIIAKNRTSNSYTSLTKDETTIIINKLNNKAFKSKITSNDNTATIGPKLKMIVDWKEVSNSQPKMKIKKYYEEKREKMNQEVKPKLSKEEVAKRLQEILTKINNDPRLTEEEKSNQTKRIVEKLKKVKGIEIREIKEENKETSSNHNGANIINTNNTDINEIPVFDANEVLKMILTMQTTIIKFIQDNTEERQ